MVAIHYARYPDEARRGVCGWGQYPTLTNHPGNVTCGACKRTRKFREDTGELIFHGKPRLEIRVRKGSIAEALYPTAPRY
jgi:hypothetical protein